MWPRRRSPVPTEKPILFSAPMVRAILAGTKTVTRRVVKFPPAMEARGIRHDLLCYTPGGPRWREYEAQLAAKDPDAWGFDAWPPGLCVSCNDETCQHLPCPYGAAGGDSLWVREAWAAWFRDDVAGQVDWKDTAKADRTEKNCTGIAYRATTGDSLSIDRWVTPLFMPRWASRITLDVVSVRVERLHDITDAEAELEGIGGWSKDGVLFKYGPADAEGDGPIWPWVDCPRTPRDAFERLWTEINGRESWTSNPWVWRVEFARS